MSESSMNIKTLGGVFSKDQLQEYTNKQLIALDKATKRIQQLEKENEYLKSELDKKTHGVEKIVVPSEQEICERQIEQIKLRAMDRELTFEDTKKLEALVRT